jgi:hypothetical protein
MKSKHANASRAAFAALALGLVQTFVLPSGAAAEGSPGESLPDSSPPPPRSVYAVASRVDWKARVLFIDIELDLRAAGLKMPEGRLEAQRRLEHDFPGLAKDAVFALQADSRRSVEDAVADGSLEAEQLVALADLARIERSSFSKDMRKFLATYGLGLGAIASPFLSGARPTPIRPPLEETPSRDYTGIVIYAKGTLPVHGEGVDGAAAPCLFPRVYDEGMRLILDRSVVVPEVLAMDGPSGGVLGYASALGIEAGERVGGDPMRVMAKELFGDERCDYVISREDALAILSREGNRELLRQGKVVVVLDTRRD